MANKTKTERQIGRAIAPWVRALATMAKIDKAEDDIPSSVLFGDGGAAEHVRSDGIWDQMIEDIANRMAEADIPMTGETAGIAARLLDPAGFLDLGDGQSKAKIVAALLSDSEA